jgi:hypothetical protein
MLRIITGVVKTTLNPALQVATNTIPMEDQHKLQTMQLYANLTVNANKNRWIWEKENKESSLKTQRYFTTTAKDLVGKHNINGKIKDRLPPMNPSSYIEIPTIDTLVEVSKTRDQRQKLLHTCLETINRDILRKTG